MFDRALTELLDLCKDRVLPFDTDAARHYADLAVTARNGGRGFPTPGGYIAAAAASRGFIVASRETSPYGAAGVTVINPWKDVWGRRHPTGNGRSSRLRARSRTGVRRH